MVPLGLGINIAIRKTALLAKLTLGSGLILLLQAFGSAAEVKQGSEFFEAKVRPILADHCYSCHGRQNGKTKGGLALDEASGIVQGGDSGPAIIPGEPDKSLLIRAVRYTDENLQMPPKNQRLSPDQIAILEEWIRIGAPTAPDRPKASAPSRTAHWAFQPVHRLPLPPVKDRAWIEDPLDAFVLARLEARNLSPSAKADKRTLLRRVTFDLTGLPPSPVEMQEFLTDETPEAYARAVDRLLSSPRYGERWARHWLDLARYADSKGYVFEEERRYPYAYTYRDYVVRACNEDLPYDQFIQEQLAADQLKPNRDARSLAALGFLTLGRRFLNNPHDIIDDRIDVVTRGLMGLTVACARCHDHKFDPISAKDYYSLYGVFASSSEPEEKPLLRGNPPSFEFAAYQAEHHRRLDELDQYREGRNSEIRAKLRVQAGDYMLAAFDSGHLSDSAQAEGLARERKLDPPTVQKWVQALEQWRKNSPNSILSLWFAYSDCDAGEVSEKAVEINRQFATEATELPALNPIVAEAFRDATPKSLLEIADRYNLVFDALERLNPPDTLARANIRSHPGESPASGTRREPSPPGDSRLERPDPSEPLLQDFQDILFSERSPAYVADAEISRLYDVPSIQKLRALKRKVEELDATHPGAPARAMALQDLANPVQPHVFIRGNPNNQGPEVPRQFIAFLAGEHPKPFTHGSGRLELAQAIASRDNPLTARVLVNRVWLHYFGAGLVGTPSDFGLRCEAPTHPELLDYLAAQFMEEGWSLKKLHRHLVLSATYQQASEDRSREAQADPANRLVWKMNRRRLDFEATRDALLAASGKLDLRMGGLSVDMLGEPFTTRRTIYGFVERQNLPSLFRTFDFASPDTTSPQRFFTTVPQQALFLINHPFAIELAQGLSKRPGAAELPDDSSRVRLLYAQVFQRPPTAREIDLALDFVHGHGSRQETGDSSGTPPNSASQESRQSLDPWARYAQVLLMSNEFVFLD